MFATERSSAKRQAQGPTEKERGGKRRRIIEIE
jgi:hypothetical protein